MGTDPELMPLGVQGESTEPDAFDASVEDAFPSSSFVGEVDRPDSRFGMLLIPDLPDSERP